MRIFFKTSSLKKHIIKEAPGLKGLYIDIKNKKWFGVRFYIYRKIKLVM